MARMHTMCCCLLSSVSSLHHYSYTFAVIVPETAMSSVCSPRSCQFTLSLSIRIPFCYHPFLAKADAIPAFLRAALAPASLDS